ncbi:MAG: sigma 54-interacting transcriptional regulator [Rickettsiales bacterium]|jgi:DNA-binding NtrC family response regulator|nr:sigma 54-interacting transcriptional regulator [Rickettsiales bacterium]
MEEVLCFGVDGMKDILKESGFKLVVVDSIEKLIKLSKNYRLLVFNLDMEKLNNKKILKEIKENNGFVKIIGVIGDGRVMAATKLLKYGLDDFLVKNSENFRNKFESLIKGQDLSEDIGCDPLNQDMFYSDPKIKSVMGFLEKIIDTKIPILLEGEAGCEHEAYARTIHAIGRQKNSEFCSVFCPSLTKNILENILYFDSGKNIEENFLCIKKLLTMRKGTVFLESIDSTDSNVQILLTKFLDFIEKNKEADVRIIAASDKNLKGKLEEGGFRKELYLKINGFTVEISALREKREIVPVVVKDLYKFYAKQESKNISGISCRALKMLKNYNWPGNTEELKNMIYNAVVIDRDGILDEDDFIGLNTSPSVLENKKNDLTINLIDSFGNFKSLQDIENETINRCLSHFSGNLSKASKNLKIGRATLYRKLETDA